MIHVCSLSTLHGTVERTGASHVVSLVNAGTPMRRPTTVGEGNHLFLAMNDIVDAAPGLTAPARHHLETYLDFVTGWDRKAPLVIHCYAGISRSTAAAFTALCALAPERDEEEIASHLRSRSPTATPNARIVQLADEMLGRDGRMVRAIERIGRGTDAFEGTPFELALQRERQGSPAL